MEAVVNDWERLWKPPHRFNRFASEDLIRWASHLEPCRVLEVGCGAGPNLRALESFGHEAWGVDIATEACSASESLPGPFHGTVITPVSATDLPFEDGFFDAVCDVQCFQHLTQEELPIAYEEAARVLKPGGQFFEYFLVKGQENFPDLAFCEFTPTPLKLAGFRIAKNRLGYHERKYRRRDGRRRRYRYVMLEATLDSRSTLTRQGKLCSSE